MAVMSPVVPQVKTRLFLEAECLVNRGDSSPVSYLAHSEPNCAALKAQRDSASPYCPGAVPTSHLQFEGTGLVQSLQLIESGSSSIYWLSVSVQFVAIKKKAHSFQLHRISFIFQGHRRTQGILCQQLDIWSFLYPKPIASLQSNRTISQDIVAPKNEMTLINKVQTLF